MAGGQRLLETGELRRAGNQWMGTRVSPSSRKCPALGGTSKKRTKIAPLQLLPVCFHPHFLLKNRVIRSVREQLMIE